MERIVKFLKSTGLSPPEASGLSALFVKKEVSSGTTLLRPGEKAQFIWMIGSGILRSFYIQEEFKYTWKENVNEFIVREITLALILDSGFLTDIEYPPKQPRVSYYSFLGLKFLGSRE